MANKVPKVQITTEAEAQQHVDEFKNIRELSNEAGTAVERLRDAYKSYYDTRFKAEPLWGGVVEDGEHGLRMTRDQQPNGHDYAIRDMPNDMILWLAEHGCLAGVNKAIEAFLTGAAPPRELADIGKYKHDKFRETFVITEVGAE